MRNVIFAKDGVGVSGVVDIQVRLREKTKIEGEGG